MGRHSKLWYSVHIVELHVKVKEPRRVEVGGIEEAAGTVHAGEKVGWVSRVMECPVAVG